MPEMSQPLSYFSIADRQMESLVPAAELFTQSLLENALFYRSALLIPDIFFFISTPLASHVLNEGRSKSFLGACLANGFAVPAFRFKGDFETALAEIKRQDIQGLQSGAVPNQVMSALQFAWENGKRSQAKNWPDEDMGAKFENELRAQLVNPDIAPKVLEGAGLSQNELDGLWQGTKKWRTECIDKAARRTKASVGLGVRRGEILNAIARDLKYPGERIHDIRSLFQFVTDERKRKELEAFFLWINYCYHRNQALSFKCALNFPRFDGISAVTSGSLLSSSDRQNGQAEIHEIRETITVPKFNTLVRMKPDELLGFRQDAGEEYFVKLIQWESTPNEDTEQKVRDALKKYSERLAIAAAAQQPGFEPAKKVISHIRGEITKEHVRNWMPVIFNAAKAWLELTGMDEAAKATSKTISLTTLETQQITIAHRPRLPTELTAPAASLSGS
jgi:hypothetical protein